MMIRDLTFFQLEILKELKFEPKYGLELIENLDVSSGRLYPNLKRLEDLGLIKGKKEDNRIYYSLSEKGLDEFQNIFRWISDCVLSIGVTLIDDYLDFIVDAIELEKGDNVFMVLKKRLKHPFIIHMGLQFIEKISEKITITGRIFMLGDTGISEKEDRKDALSHITFMDDFGALPDNIVDKSCILMMHPNKKIMKECERITKSELKLIGKLYSDFFVEKCFQSALGKIDPEIRPPFLIGLKKEELLETLKEFGYKDPEVSTWGGAFVIGIPL
ncbi:MAG: PadR family transcriptional regulator [Euryarchaeota archaeon]|nr:PadR family transcriptional regulator [Euryarchaeota archaeon]